ncbi:uncharacterized protein RSE6_05299 [Rhynchosporium secalis]|uniref:DUF7896 domain-containing protein n=1 Tax=Rhynchosporium secalis TaxID=38038 RepID=A0A1E1M7G1_RHYSE|nr:uncharacterized protein RSE6_05299 [Rhynchosporium secalis]
MSSNLMVDTSMDFAHTEFEQDQKRQLLLIKLARIAAEKEQLDAQLALLPSSNLQPTPQHQRTPIHRQGQQRRGSHVPRSMSSTGAPAMSRPLSDRNETSQRPRALSSRSGASMARANSRGNPSPRPTVPFTQHGAIPPPLSFEPLQENSMIMDWASQEQPYTSYTFSQQNTQLQMSMPQRPGLQLVAEDPGAYISRTFGNIYSPEMPNPSSAMMSNSQLASGSFIQQQAQSTPTTESLTTATTLPSEISMSRQTSLCNGVESMQFTSNSFPSADHSNDQSTFDYVPSFSSSHLSHRPSNEEQSQLLVGAGGAIHESTSSSHSRFSSSDPLGGTKMEKSASTSSTSSSSSLRSHKRMQERLQEHIAAGQARQIMPKSLPMSRDNSSQSMARMDSKDGLQDQIAASKPGYKRPKHDRVFCKLCENHPDGFRGEHEHRRHVDREHKSMVKKWVCVEPKDDGQHPKPIVPLSKCKACSTQKKKYGAYYNAAAHLRRAHFNPKPKGRGKSQQKVEDAAKRGAKSGGDEPDMPELKKYWMKEVEERAEYTTGALQEAADDSDEELFDASFDGQSFTQQHLSSISNRSFDGSIYNNTDNTDNNNDSNNNNNNNNNNTSHYSSTSKMNDAYGAADTLLDFSDPKQQAYMSEAMYSLPNQYDFLSFPADLFQNELLGLPTHPFLVPSQSYDGFGQWNT